MIICAAIKLTKKAEMLNGNVDMIVCGHRHGNCFSVISELDLSWRKATKIQGFINHKGAFLDRKEALAHALECGQLSETNRCYQQDHNIDELYSEDLY